MNISSPLFTVSRRDYDAVIFDLDGVVTQTARVHARAWKALFDEYLDARAKREGADFSPFDPDRDYRKYVDGMPRYDGVESFLASRDIRLPQGSPDDAPGKETVCGLGNKKNELFLDYMHKEGIEVYDSTVALLRALKNSRFKTAVVSSSKNCGPIVDTAGLADLFDSRVDGVDAEQLGLSGKPDPDIFLEAAHRLEVSPARCIVVEDAIAGVLAGERGGFGCVIGVDRTNHSGAYKQKGADIVVKDLSEVTVSEMSSPVPGSDQLPSALEHVQDIMSRGEGKRMAVFLDYDGTLTPIVSRPELAVLSDEMRDTLSRVADTFPTAIISGRDRADVKQLVNVDTMYYAGSHGFDIEGPEGEQIQAQQGLEYLPVLDRAEQQLRERLRRIGGALIERKKFSIAVHYRGVAGSQVSLVDKAVKEVAEQNRGLRRGEGKKVYEVQPDIEWDKGRALHWLLDALELDEAAVMPLYIGDDVTDEDAFRELREGGVGILVAHTPQRTMARYRLGTPDEVRRFLELLMARA